MNTNFLDEDLDMVEVLDHPALFSNGRILRAAVPKGAFMRMTSMKAAIRAISATSRRS